MKKTFKIMIYIILTIIIVLVGFYFYKLNNNSNMKINDSNKNDRNFDKSEIIFSNEYAIKYNDYITSIKLIGDWRWIPNEISGSSSVVGQQIQFSNLDSKKEYVIEKKHKGIWSYQSGKLLLIGEEVNDGVGVGFDNVYFTKKDNHLILTNSGEIGRAHV